MREKLSVESDIKDHVCDQHRFLPQLPPGVSLDVLLFLGINATYCHFLVKHALSAYLTLLISLHFPFCMSPGIIRATTATAKEKLSLKRICP